MLEIYDGTTELYAVVLDYAKRKRESGGAPPGGSVEMMTRNLQLRLHLEVLDDGKVREIASKTLDDLANLGRGLAPGPGEQEMGREQAATDLKAVNSEIESLAARIGELARAEQSG
jgi:hypothetical protein